LLFELTIKRRGNIDRGANGILLHTIMILFHACHKYGK
jgi:hypothetical protein